MQRALQLGRFEHDEVFERLQETIFESGKVLAYCVDDTGIVKKGERSVGVQRQYSGTLGKIGNCQVVVSLHGVSDSFGACLGLQLYCPQSWCDDTTRRDQANIPAAIVFKKKWQIAVDLLDSARERGGSMPVLADAGYGDSREFRDGLRERGLKYVVAISSKTSVWKPGTEVGIPKRRSRKGPAPKRVAAADGSEPVLVDTLAKELDDAGAFKRVCWRMGMKGPLQGDFVAIRIRSAEGRSRKQLPGEEEWLIVEREKTGEFNYYLSSMSSRATLKTLVGLARMRWHIERDYQDMKQQLGFDSVDGSGTARRAKDPSSASLAEG